MKLVSFEDLFLCLLSDIYMVETQLVKDIPVMMQKVHSEELRVGLQDHLEETKEQVSRLDRIFKILNQQPKQVEWVSDMKNLFSDVGVFLRENQPSAVLDAAIIAIAQ